MWYRDRQPWSRLAVEYFGDLMHEARRDAECSQRKLERLSGIDQTMISRMERGLRPGARLVIVARVFAGLENARTAARVIPYRPPDDEPWIPD